MKFVYADGGRSAYFKAGNVGDCVTRAICNATGRDYKEVYKALSAAQKKVSGKRSARDGVNRKVLKHYIEREIGARWVACMGIGTGCRVHLCAEELPKGKLIVNLSGHLSCVKDGVLYDTYDCTRGGSRCVYGYWVVG